MNYIALDLNGAWEMKYSEEKYTKTTSPYLNIIAEEDAAGTEPEDTTNDIIENAVPRYWEDMADEFQATSFYNKLRVNPEYGIQRYPIVGYAPDMALPNIIGSFFYRRDFNYQSNNGEIKIYFEGVQNCVSVWINDKYIGNHEGYSAPFELDIPKNVLIEGKNTIVLSVSNHRLSGYMGEPISGLTSRAANECTGGITGKVEIREYVSFLRNITVSVSEDCNEVTANVTLSENKAFKWAVKDGDETVLEGSADSNFTFNTDKLSYWSPESPKTYTLVLSDNENSISTVFGVRRLAADGVHLKLNNKPYYLRGICEHCYFPETIHPNHDKVYYRKIVKEIKKLGFNFIRFHTYIPEEEYMQAADELGVLLHVECPNNTTLEEWKQIVAFCKRHTSVVIYCCGNELLLDEPFIEYINMFADVVHNETDALFSPMSALRGLEYFWVEPEQEHKTKNEPFKHHPERIAKTSQFSDVYSTYTNGNHSYFSTKCNPGEIDLWSSVYNKPRVSHEICIDGTYTDLSLKNRYVGTKVGNTEMFSSLEKHLADKGLLEKAPTFFKNSSQWQRRIRKYCFENVRRSNTISGYDFLGPIDTHWHTFGYDVGMMNEFYELKPGETVRNVLMYNSPTVLLTDIGMKRNYYANETFKCSIYTSHYGDEDIKDGTLTIRISVDGKISDYKTVNVQNVENGKVTKLYDLEFVIPNVENPSQVILYVTLDSKNLFAENEWELYSFPKVTMPMEENVTIVDSVEIDDLKNMLEKGKTVMLFGAGPFVSLPTSFRISLAGRTSGNLATIINDHPVLNKLVHDGYCGWQFASMLENGEAVCFDAKKLPYNPIIEVASTHKYAVPQSALFEYKVKNGKLLVCSLNFDDSDPAAQWLKAELIIYADSEEFTPEKELSFEQIDELANLKVAKVSGNRNLAFNANDKTAMRKKKGE